MDRVSTTARNPVERVREELHVTRTELALRTELDYPLIYRAELGTRRLHPKLAQAIARLRGTTPLQETQDYQDWIERRG